MSKDKNPTRTARREARQRRQLPPDAVCIRCGEGDPAVLQQHHPMGRVHEPSLTGVLCKNCHGKATEGQLREDVPLSATDNLLDRIAAIFGGLAAFFRFLADSFDRLTEQIKAFIGRLDVELPEWRLALSGGG